MLENLEPGMTVISATGESFVVDDVLAREFAPGDRLIANALTGLLRIPGVEHDVATAAVAECAAAFDLMDRVDDGQIVTFFHTLAEAFASNDVWEKIRLVNLEDVRSAKARGRSTTRLAVSQDMRKNMINGLRVWADTPSRRDAVLESISHQGFSVELVGAALGVVAFVFEGRPNVLADACGVLRGGNTAIFRIGSDALATARAMMNLAVGPSLQAAGLPAGAITLIDSPSHAAGWSLFLDARLALAVARGSGPTVDQLGALAESVGTPVSLHGTGGAWIVASSDADPFSFGQAVTGSLDRKVCNTLNTCVLVRSSVDHLLPVLLESLQSSADRLNTSFKLHVVENSVVHVPAELFQKNVQIIRAKGMQQEMQAVLIAESGLCIEWEWEGSPEISLVIVDDIDCAVDLFNQYSPRLVASLVSRSEPEQERFWNRIRSPFVGDGHTRWVDGQVALAKPELGLSNWSNGRLFGRGGILTGDNVYTVRTRYKTHVV